MKTATRIISVIIVLTVATTAKAQFFNRRARLNAPPVQVRSAPAPSSNLGQGLRFAQPVNAIPPNSQTPTTVGAPVRVPVRGVPARYPVSRQTLSQQALQQQALQQQALRQILVQQQRVAVPQQQTRYRVVQPTRQQQRIVTQSSPVPRFTSKPAAAQPTQTFAPVPAKKQQVANNQIATERFTTQTQPSANLISLEPPATQISKQKTPTDVSADVVEQSQSSTLKSVLIKHTVRQ